MHEIQPGRYRHYKGNEYTVLGVARHSESLEELVVYRPEYGEHGLWVRPRHMFLETVHVDGNDVPRFQRLTPDERLPAEIVHTLLSAGQVRIERIVSEGQASPPDFWYDQPQHEWVLLLTGAAKLGFDGGPTIDLKPGDYVNLPAHTRHRVEWTTPAEQTIWLAVHYGDMQ